MVGENKKEDMNLIKDIIGKIVKKKLGGRIGIATLLSMMVAGLTGCSEDLDFRGGINEVPEGTLQISFAVPDPIVVKTRGIDETAINNVDVFIFSNDTKSLIQHQSLDAQYVTDNTIHLSLKDQARNANVLIYAVANVNGTNIQGGSEIDDLRKFELDQDIKDGFLPMIGYATVNTALNNSPTISLYRSEAKVSVSCKEGVGTVEGIEIYRNSEKGYLGSPVNTEDAYKDYRIHKGSVLTADPSNEAFASTITYSYPSEGVTKGDDSKGAYAIVKVKRSGSAKDMYYRLNFRTEIDDELTYLSLEPNHHYQISITGFMTDGYDTALEASKHPESDQFVIYAIHDHAAEVLSMVTDGVNELGVSPEVLIKIDERGHRTGKLIVKCFAPGEEVAMEKITIDYPEDWLEIKESKEHTHPDGKNDPSMSYDKDDQKGQQFEYEFEILSQKELYEDRSWDITVTWDEKKLSRTVKARYEAAFLLPNVCTATLTIINNNEEIEDIIPDYWTFITGAGTSVNKNNISNSTPKLYGIHPEDMAGDKKRSNGFHFPMPYGEKDGKVDPWSYEYTIDFTELLNRDGTGDVIDNIEVTTAGDSFWQDKIDWKRNGNIVTLKLKSVDKNYEYAGGTITFTISYGGNSDSSTVIIASLYHTGFFHYEGREAYTNKPGYYYYEVVPMGNNGDYWLDRNICATSNRSFVDVSDDPNVDRSAAGLHYTIIKTPQPYKLPEFDFSMCPPGYHIPNQTEWDNLRMSKKFMTLSVNYDNTLYMSTYYATDNPKIGNVYIQKSMFVNGNNIYEQNPKYSDFRTNGDTGAGYYWSVSEAPAMEKEQMGNWLRALYLNGSASSYTNASVTDHRMPVRCKAGTEKQATTAHEYYVSLNVHEATHVYLFEVDNDSYNPLYTFPGKAVGTTNSAVKWQHFYCATTIDPQKLRAIFVKLEKDGKVTVYTRNGNSFNTDQTYNSDYLLEDNSWSLANNGLYYDFCETGKDREGGNVFDKDYMGSKFPGKDYPTDCITEDESSGGGGGSGELLSGDYEWEGYFGGSWSNNWQNLTSKNYDWSTVTVGSTITIWVEAWWTDLIIRFCYADGNWEATQICNQVGYWDLTPNDPGTGEGTRKVAQYTLTLTQDMIDKLKDNGGLVIYGNNFQMNKLELKIKY